MHVEDQDRKQQATLPLAEAEGQFAERRAMLNAAITAAECDLHVATLLRIVFESTNGGLTDVQYKHEDLKRRPDRLCCELSTVRTAVARAKASGLISVRPSATRDGFRAPNAYSIDWAAVARWNGRPLPSVDRPLPTVANSQTPVAISQTYVASSQTSASWRHTEKHWENATAARIRGGKGGDSCLGTKQEQEIHPPPPPPPPNTTESARTRQTWHDCESAMRAMGMKASSAAIVQAQQKGMCSDDVAGLIDHWRCHDGWGPGAIFHAIRQWRPGDVATDEHLWPTPALATEWRF